MTTQRKNINKEQFFTQHETANRLAKVIMNQTWYKDVTTTIEPSAGDGAWLDAMPVNHAYDIEPKHDNVILQDFIFDVDEKSGKHNLMKLKSLTNEERDKVLGSADFKIVRRTDGSKVLVVGNPPFGRMGKLAKAFMRKCETFADYIAFILPASFTKASVIRQMPKTLHLIYQEDLLDETFRFERDGKKVATVFQIWERREEHRVDPIPVHECNDFKFITAKHPDGTSKEDRKNLPAPCPSGVDIAVCTHGSGVGKVTTDYNVFKSFSTRTHRYVKIKSKIDKQVLATKLRALDYNSVTKYTVGATCISTNEIVVLYKNLIGE